MLCMHASMFHRVLYTSAIAYFMHLPFIGVLLILKPIKCFNLKNEIILGSWWCSGWCSFLVTPENCIRAVKFSLTSVSTATVSKEWGRRFGGAHRSICSAAVVLPLYVLCGWGRTWALVIPHHYTLS